MPLQMGIHLVRGVIKQSIREAGHLEMRSSRTRMMIFKTKKAANADFSEQRRKEAFAAL